MKDSSMMQSLDVPEALADLSSKIADAIRNYDIDSRINNGYIDNQGHGNSEA